MYMFHKQFLISLKKELLFRLDKKDIELKLSKNLITKDYDDYKRENAKVLKFLTR